MWGDYKEIILITPEVFNSMKQDMKQNMNQYMNQYTHIRHTFSPIYDANSSILILGSLPSVKSREEGFYYGHPQNRFWKVIAHILEENVPQTIEEKKDLLLTNNIAIWDVIESCDIVGSSDSSIKNVIVNDFSGLLSNSQIKSIYTNGNKAYELYNRYAVEKTGMEAIKLPSTSPANAAYNFDKLCEVWKKVIQ